MVQLERDSQQYIGSDFDQALSRQICVLRDNVIKRSNTLGMNNPRQLWLKTQESGLEIASSYVSRLWNYKHDEDSVGKDQELKQPNFSISKVLVLSISLECPMDELLADSSPLENNNLSKLSFSGKFYDKMVQACSETMSRLVAMERVAILKPLQAEDVIDLQFSSFNQIKNN
jgi:hypothetical protein